MERIIGFDPITHGQDTVLIVGSMPSIESLKQGMYYANRTNRFWKILGHIYDMEYETKAQKLTLLEKGHIALWDICHTCIRKGSMDADIKEVEPNDIQWLLKNNPSIRKIICNGKTSLKFMKRYFPELDVISMPSTSAANATWSLDRLMEVYKTVLEEKE